MEVLGQPCHVAKNGISPLTGGKRNKKFKLCLISWLLHPNADHAEDLSRQFLHGGTATGRLKSLRRSGGGMDSTGGWQRSSAGHKTRVPTCLAGSRLWQEPIACPPRRLARNPPSPWHLCCVTTTE